MLLTGYCQWFGYVQDDTCCECGKRFIADDTRDPSAMSARVVGGFETTYGAFPWQVKMACAYYYEEAIYWPWKSLKQIFKIISKWNKYLWEWNFLLVCFT